MEKLTMKEKVLRLISKIPSLKGFTNNNIVFLKIKEVDGLYPSYNERVYNGTEN